MAASRKLPPVRPTHPVRPVMSASLSFGPNRPWVDWTSSDTKTVRPNPLGASTRNGRHGMARPAANPPANQARPWRARAPVPAPAVRPASSAGAKAQILTAAAKPKQAPPRASRRAPASWQDRNTSIAPSRQSRFSHGSSSRACDAISAAG